MRPLLILFCTLMLADLFSQSQTIEGRVVQSQSDVPLSGVTILLESTAFHASTDHKGNFALNEIPEGDYQLIASSFGFVTSRLPVSVTSGQVLHLDIELTEQVAELQEVVVMTKGLSGIRNIPGSAHFISPREIQKFSYTDVSRALGTLPGINIQEEDGFGLRPNIGLRGTGVERSSKITIMEDGVLIAPAPYSEPAAYYFPTMGRMQAIEVVKGSSQIKYGPFTTGGAINLLSTQIPSTFSGRFNLMGGSHGNRILHAFVGDEQKHLAYLVESFQYRSDGFKKLDGGGTTGFDKKDYLAKLRLQTAPDVKLPQSLSVRISQTLEESDETYLGLTREDFDREPFLRYAASQKDLMSTKQTHLSLMHTISLSSHAQLATTAYRTEFSRNWYKLDKVEVSDGTKLSIGSILDDPSKYAEAYDVLLGTPTGSANKLYVKANNRSYEAKGIQSAFSLSFVRANWNHRIDLGLRIHWDWADRFQWEDHYTIHDKVMALRETGTPGTESNRIIITDAAAAYLQYRLRNGKFTATPGVRYENIFVEQKDYGKADPERSGAQLSLKQNRVSVFIPGISIQYQANKFSTVFLGVHKGFAPPGAQDGTLPEASINYELGSRWQKGSFLVQAVLFLNDYSNLLGSDLAAGGGTGTGDLFNAGEVRSHGIEFQINGDLNSKKEGSDKYSLPIGIAYTYSVARFQSSFKSTYEDWGSVQQGDHFPYLPAHQLSLLAGVHYGAFRFDASLRFVDVMRTEPGQGTIALNEKTDAHFTIDLSSHYSVYKTIDLFASVANLLDVVYIAALRPAGLRPGMPRSFTLGLKAAF
ncbi:MAG: TonB-dependent receptor [Saprospiraceae bacterium]|nr:TonB-dependent receptor [Saprospiraceae bacterium]